MPATSTPQPNVVKMPPELAMELDILGDIEDLIDVPEGMLSDFDAWAHSLLDYIW